MQHTLVPAQDRKRLHSEYFIRLIIVSLCLFSVAVIIGVGALFPAYIRSWLSFRSAKTNITEVKKAKADIALDDANKELTNNQVLLDILANNFADSQFSDLIRAIILVRGNNLITSFDISRGADGVINVSIGGVAPTRDDLLGLKGRLMSGMPDIKIDVPIEQLARSSNLPFKLDFSKKIK